MRVIRTEMYFDPRDVEWPETERMFGNPGVAFAFAKCDSKNLNLSELPLAMLLPPDQIAGLPFDIEFAHRLFDAFVRNDSSTTDLFTGETQNSRIAAFILTQDIVVERSPAENLHIGDLIRKAVPAGVAIGSLIGFKVAADNPLLLFITVPSGIVIVSSAIGISKALEMGLNKMIERLLTRRKTRRKGRRLDIE